MIDRIRSLLPIELTNSYDIIYSLKKSKEEWRYKFMDDGEFSKLTDLGLAHAIYWKEMVTRVHIIVLVSLFKTMRWMDSLDDTINNYYGFCASLRGLIESCVDAFYTLEKVPLTLAVDYCVIKKQIRGESVVLTDHQRLENELLHYIQATKLDKQDRGKYPDFCNAKPMSEYLESISKHDEALKRLYALLCGITHPAYESERIFLFFHEGETIVCNDSFELERQLNIDLMEEWSESLITLFNAFMNNSISIMLLLNYFELPEIELTYSGSGSFKSTPIWTDIWKLMVESESKYQKALANGLYE